jgi:hypothetical protein
MEDYEILQQNALNFWPLELSEKEKKASIIPKLIESQDKFISLLNIADASPFSWKNTLEHSKSLPANLFLKHLMVLSDVGGERLERFKNELRSIFPASNMLFAWEKHTYTYSFQTLHTRDAWNNKNLFVDGENLHRPQSLTPLIEDASMLLLFGGSATADTLPQEILDKCIIGTLLGKKDELDTFVRQRYIWVSRITGGATANTMGQLAQAYVIEHLRNTLPKWDFSSKHIPEISQNDGRTPIGFDVVACSPKSKYCAIEISFQVTTNSTIERKAGQAQARYHQLHEHGHHIAYVIDGAGNFKRKSALSTIMNYSDCTVTFKPEELNKLVKFLTRLEKA